MIVVKLTMRTYDLNQIYLNPYPLLIVENPASLLKPVLFIVIGTVPLHHISIKDLLNGVSGSGTMSLKSLCAI